MNLLKTSINQCLNSMNELEEGILLILFGVIISIISKYFHKDWKKEGYKPFNPFRRKGKTQSEDNVVIIMYMRTLLGIYAGFGIIFFGIFKILAYFR